MQFHKLVTGAMDLLKSCFGACGGSSTTPRQPETTTAADSTPQFVKKHPSDEEILNFENQLRREEASSNPLVSALLPLEVLHDEYTTSAFAVKVQQLSEKFSGMRRCRRDGNCFYRAIAFAILQFFREGAEGATEIKAAWDAKLKAVGFEPIIYEDFSECFWNFATNAEQGTTTLESLWDGEEYSCDMAVMYLRLLTSAEMKTNMDMYSAFIDSEDGDFVRWCERNVEAVGVDADQVQMIALSRSIGVPLTIANLGSGECETDLSISTFEIESINESLPKTITLLYRPGHYDLLYE